MGGMIRHDGANRIVPALPVTAMKTYSIKAPIQTHHRPATCAEADCPHHLNGWSSTFDVSTDLGREQAGYVRAMSGRKFVEERVAETMVRFTFEAGQQCFRSDEHTVPLEREPFYIVRGGDWRGNTGSRRDLNADNWVDDFATHQEQLADRLSEG